MGLHVNGFVNTNEKALYKSSYKTGFITCSIAMVFSIFIIVGSCMFTEVSNKELNRAKNKGCLMGCLIGSICNIPFLIGFILGIVFHQPLLLLLAFVTVALAIPVGIYTIKKL